MYFKIMSPICYGIIGYLLSESGVTHETWAFWGVLIMLVVIQVMTCIEIAERYDND